MLSRLPISLAQLKAGNDFEKLKNENYCILCTDKKNLQKYLQKFGRHYLKHGNNFYRQQKQWNKRTTQI